MVLYMLVLAVCKANSLALCCLSGFVLGLKAVQVFKCSEKYHDLCYTVFQLVAERVIFQLI